MATSTVAPVATPAPSTPVSTPAPSTPVSTPVAAPETTTVATPTPATPATPARPNRADYGERQSDFDRDSFRWDFQHSDGEQPAEAAPETQAEQVAEVAADPAAEAPVEAAAETTEEKPAEPQTTEPSASPTPEAIAKMEGEIPALKELFNQHPEVKGQFYKMARENAKLAPLGELFPNVETAQFAADTANRTVGIKSAFLRAADDPEQIGSAFEQFVNEFRECDDKGQPLSDDQGNPVLGKDFEFLTNHIVNNYLDGELGDIEAGLKSGRYASETAKDRAETAVQALRYLKEFKDADPLDFDAPDTSGMSDSERSAYDARMTRIKQKEEELGLRQKQQQTEAQRAARSTHDKAVRQQVASQFGARLDQMVTEKVKSDVNIPVFALQMTNPKTGVSFFAQSVYDQFNEITVGHFDKASGKYVGGIAKVRSDLAALESKPPSEQTAKERTDYFKQLQEEFMPRIVDAEIAKLQKAEKAQRASRETQSTTARANVEPQVRGGATPQPKAMTEDQAWTKARAEVNADPKNQYLSDAEKEGLVIKKVWPYIE